MFDFSRYCKNIILEFKKFWFYFFYVFRSKLASKSFSIMLFVILIIFVGLAAFFKYVINPLTNSNDDILNTIQKILPYVYTFQIAIVGTVSITIFLLIGFISSDVNEQKTSRSMELIISSMKPRSTMNAIIAAYFLILILMGGWCILNIYISKVAFNNFFFDEIGILPKDMPIKDYFLGIAVLLNNSFFHSQLHSGVTYISSGISWNGDAGHFGFFFYNSSGVISFQPLVYGSDILTENSLISSGITICLIAVIHFIFSIILFSYLTIMISSIFSTNQEMQYALVPILFLVSLPLILFPFLLSNGSANDQGGGAYTSPLFIKILSYIPFANTSLIINLFIDPNWSLINKWFVLISDAGSLFLVAIISNRIYKYGVLNYSSSNLFSQLYSTFKLVFGFKKRH